MAEQFEWDKQKARGNVRKHGVSFEEATSVFNDPAAITGFDPQHSDDEDRFILLGESNRRRLLVVVFTDREGTMRIITARKANSRERKQYEEGP